MTYKTIYKLVFFLILLVIAELTKNKNVIKNWFCFIYKTFDSNDLMVKIKVRSRFAVKHKLYTNVFQYACNFKVPATFFTSPRLSIDASHGKLCKCMYFSDSVLTAQCTVHSTSRCRIA